MQAAATVATQRAATFGLNAWVVRAGAHRLDVDADGAELAARALCKPTRSGQGAASRAAEAGQLSPSHPACRYLIKFRAGHA